jgi:DNA-binding transcriptional LysR family regulator
MLKADNLTEFAAVVDAGSISEAARALDVGRTSLSRRLSQLEARLGVRLLHRETRRLTLTPAGEELYQRAQRVVVDVDAAWESVRKLDATPRGPLRVSVPDARLAAANLFVRFAEDFPEVRLEVTMTARHVDLIGEGIDVAIRFGNVANESLVTRKLSTTTSLLVASPAYFQRRGMPSTPRQLADHDCIVGFAGERTPALTWPLLSGGSIRISPRFCAEDIGLRVVAAERGLGIALVPRALIAEQLGAQHLLPVLEDQVGVDTPMNLVFVDRTLMPPAMRVFIDRAVAFFSKQVETTRRPSSFDVVDP